MDQTLEELRNGYYLAIANLDNEDDIRNSLPSIYYDNFDELINLIINKIDEEIKDIYDLLNEQDSNFNNELNNELDFLNLKKKICLELIDNYNNQNKLIEEYLSNSNKHLIFAKSNIDNILFLRDLKDIPEEYYEIILDLLNKLENNIFENNEIKDKKLNGNLNDIYEKKSFKIRICYRMLTPDTCYIMLVKMKKSNNDLKDRNEIVNRKLNTENDYQMVKKLLLDSNSREDIISSNALIKNEIIEYLNVNKRGDYHKI